LLSLTMAMAMAMATVWCTSCDSTLTLNCPATERERVKKKLATEAEREPEPRGIRGKTASGHVHPDNQLSADNRAGLSRVKVDPQSPSNSTVQLVSRFVAVGPTPPHYFAAS
jgi:hypothetical protein